MRRLFRRSTHRIFAILAGLMLGAASHPYRLALAADGGVPVVDPKAAGEPDGKKSQPPTEADHKAAEARLAATVGYLASPELEGRGLGGKGIDLAADYIAKQFADAGLQTDLYEGKPFQRFTITHSKRLGEGNNLTLVGPPSREGDPPQRLELKLGRDFTPLSLGGSGQINAPLVFAGYGITAKPEKYDDYAGLNVEGKFVVILRHEPQQDEPKSVFNGTRDSQYAPLRRKVENARAHKAAGVIFVTDDVEIRRKLAVARKRWLEALDRLAAERAKVDGDAKPAPADIERERVAIERALKAVEQATKQLQEESDPVLPFASGDEGGNPLPVLHCRRGVIDWAIKAALKSDLAEIERRIDDGPKPQSAELTGWRVEGQTSVVRVETEVKNVIARLPGSGPLADEAIVVGAHYDHLGLGDRGSLAGGKGRVIHPGADDNASGVAVLLEAARQLAARPKQPARAVLFIAFTGEESGILGSSHYVRNPLVAMDKTAAMVNLDMVGRLREGRLSLLGGSSGKQFDEVLDRIRVPDGLHPQRLVAVAGPSDQAPFYARKVPVVHFFTGMHGDYHRPSDVPEKINVPGMRLVADYLTDFVAELAARPERVDFVAVPLSGVGKTNRPVLGIMPEFAGDAAGVKVAAVLPDGPAAKAEVRAGDIIVQFAGAKIANLEELQSALKKHKGGDKVRIVLRRDEETIEIDVVLAAPR